MLTNATLDSFATSSFVTIDDTDVARIEVPDDLFDVHLRFNHEIDLYDLSFCSVINPGLRFTTVLDAADDEGARRSAVREIEDWIKSSGHVCFAGILVPDDDEQTEIIIDVGETWGEAMRRAMTADHFVDCSFRCEPVSRSFFCHVVENGAGSVVPAENIAA